MVNLREAQYILLHCHTDNLIDDEEFALLHDVNKRIPNFSTGHIHLSILKKFMAMNVMQNLGILKTGYTA